MLQSAYYKFTMTGLQVVIKYAYLSSVKACYHIKIKIEWVEINLIKSFAPFMNIDIKLSVINKFHC